MTSDSLAVFAIYDSPTDYPGKFVVRRWDVYAFEDAPVPGAATVHDTLEEAREAVPWTADFRYPRAADDDPKIVETWM